jgi:hypothetical protein
MPVLLLALLLILQCGFVRAQTPLAWWPLDYDVSNVMLQHSRAARGMKHRHATLGCGSD